MIKGILTFILLTVFQQVVAQPTMRRIDQLINLQESSWPNILNWVDSAKNTVEILAVDTTKAREALFNTQVTTRSPMGAIVYNCGGILIDHGWIRILGSGDDSLHRSLPNWNRGKAFNEFGEQPSFLLIADDVVGGFFFLNGGGLGEDLGNVYYFAPDNLTFEPLNVTYTDFLLFCFNADLNLFYKNIRWKNWEEDIKTLQPNQVFSFFPYLWTTEGQDISTVIKKAVPIEEQYFINIEFLQQMDQK